MTADIHQASLGTTHELLLSSGADDPSLPTREFS